MAEDTDLTVEREALASIHGLILPEDLLDAEIVLELEPGLSVVNLDTHTQRLMHQTETVRRVGIFRWGERLPAVRLLYHAPPSPPESEADSAERANDVLQQVLERLRVYRPGSIYFGGIIHRKVHEQGAIELFHRPWIAKVMPLYLLSDHYDLRGFAEFWRVAQSAEVRNLQHIALAVRWFSTSLETRRTDDAVICIMTSLESLFTAGTRSQKGRHIAESAAALFSSSPERQEIHDIFADTYRLRNDILHKGHSYQWRPHPAGRDIEVPELVDQATHYARRCIALVIRRTASNQIEPNSAA